MSIFILRHGDIDAPLNEKGQRLIYPPDAPLNKRGMAQMQGLGTRLAEQGVFLGTIYTSPSTRAQQSAEILAGILGGNIIVEQGFADCYIPRWIGVPLSALEEIGGDVYAHPKSPDQESYEHMAARVLTAFQKVAKEAKESIGIVSHGDPIRVLVQLLKHPSEPIPPMSELSTYDYAKKGEGWEIILSDKGDVIELKFLSTDESPTRGQKEY